MLPTLIAHLFILALLLTHIESAVDSVNGEHPHADSYAHKTDPTQLINNDTSANHEANKGHCKHCCHGVPPAKPDINAPRSVANCLATLLLPFKLGCLPSHSQHRHHYPSFNSFLIATEMRPFQQKIQCVFMT